MELVYHYNYLVALILMMMGIYIMIASRHLVKKLLGLSIFQTAVLLFYISMSPVKGSRAPIYGADLYDNTLNVIYANPIPQVLMLTAIVVGVATLGVGLAIAVRIKGKYGTVDEAEMLAADAVAESASCTVSPALATGEEKQ
jgi:multicomponent Na+:H+ antiporter subunit C